MAATKVKASVNLNSDGSFMNAEQIAKDMINNRIDKKDFIEFRKIKPDDLISLHFNMGMWIRNSYGLWDETNPHTTMGADDPTHPDQLSFEIIKTVHRRLNQSISIKV